MPKGVRPKPGQVVAKLRESISKVADFVPLNSLPETSTPFAHLTPHQPLRA